MKVMQVQNRINFGRALNPEEMKEFNAVRDEGKKLVGQTGKSILIVHDACLPQSKSINTGVGNLSTKDSKEFFEYMKPYLGFNIVEVLPPGQANSAKDFYCAYGKTGLALGNHQINPELLTQDQFGKILNPEEFDEIVKSNTTADKETIVNYKNVMDIDSAQNKILKKAHERFILLDENTKLKQDYSKYIKENAYWLDIPREAETDLDFFRFKQFIADEHLKIGKESLNKQGIKLFGDCQISFSEDEIKAFPKAFKEGHYVGDPDWGIRALDYDTITDPTSDAAKLLKQKVQLFAKRYDSIRFDVAWAYVTPKITPIDGTAYHKPMGSAVLEFIEKSIKEIKGEKFNLKDLIYEFDAGENDFKPFKEGCNELIEPLKNRVKIYGSTYMHHNDHFGWGSNDAYLKWGWHPDEFVIGVGNHDPQPLKQIAIRKGDICAEISEQYHKDDSIKPLARILKLDEGRLTDSVEFAKAKWAEPMMAKNNQMFYMDVFGREERFDVQNLNTVTDKSRNLYAYKNYAYKIPENYKETYHKAVQEGFGFNIMDSLEKVFKAKDLNKSHPELYSKIVKFKDVLYEKDLPKAAEEIIEEAQEIVTESAKKNKYLKPFLISGAVILVGGLVIYTSFKGKKKLIPQYQPQQNINPNTKVSFDNFIKSSK